MSTGIELAPLDPHRPHDIGPPAARRHPPLQGGDRLSAEEFERRYNAMPELKKAELINGVVYMPSPVIFEDHGGPHFDLIGWLGLYRMATPGVRGGDNSTLRLPLANRPQPDACLIVLPSHGGQVRIPFYGPLMLPFGVNQYDLGLFQTPSGPLYVNAGIGYFHLNVRFNCRPEITVFEI